MKIVEMNGIVFPRLGNNELVEIKGVRYRACFMNGARYFFFESVDEEMGKLDYRLDMEKNRFDEITVAKGIIANKIKRITSY